MSSLLPIALLTLGLFAYIFWPEHNLLPAARQDPRRLPARAQGGHLREPPRPQLRVPRRQAPRARLRRAARQPRGRGRPGHRRARPPRTRLLRQRRPHRLILRLSRTRPRSTHLQHPRDVTLRMILNSTKSPSRLALALLAFAALTGSALAAAPITGTVINKTTNKPAAGDDVVLIRLAQGMQESTRAKTDKTGHFSLDVPDSDSMHLVRVTHDKANYFQPVPPGTNHLDFEVFTAAAKVEGVSRRGRRAQDPDRPRRQQPLRHRDVLPQERVEPAQDPVQRPPLRVRSPRRRGRPGLARARSRRHARAHGSGAARQRPLHLYLPHPPRRDPLPGHLHGAL